MKKNQIFEEVSQTLSERSVGLFFGAGASRTAGIPTAKEIVNKIISSLELPDKYTKETTSLKYPFEAFLEILSRYAPLDKMLSVFQYGVPTEFHWMVKHMVENNYVKQIMSTNFDVLIEKTSISDINSLFDEKQFNNIPSDRVNYIKIHGDIEHPETIRTVMGSIVQSRLKSKRKEAIDFLFNNPTLKTILILGYSCSDRMDLSPFIRSNSNNSHANIIFINHTTDGKICKRAFPKDHLFYGYNGYILDCNTDELVHYIIKNFDISYCLEQDKFNVERCLDYSEMSVYKKYLFIAGILFRNGYYEKALDALKEALTFDGEEELWAEIISFMYEVYHNIQTREEKSINKILRPNDTFQSLENNKEKALDILSHISDKKTRLDRLAGLAEHWGHLLLSFEKYEEALIEYKKALGLFEQTKNVFRIYQCLNNIANTTFISWKKGATSISDEEVYKECYRIWLKCLVYFRRSKYLFEYEIACSNMVELLLHLNTKPRTRIKQYLEKAEELSIYLNDNTGIDECANLRNLFNQTYKKE